MSQVINYAEPTTPAPGATSAATPVEPPGQRIDSLDLLRGASILGILLMNTQSMSMPSWAYFDPTYYHPTGPVDLANYLTWCVVHVLADVKLLTIFSMLFGAGVIIQAQRVAARGKSPAAVHYRRMLGLLLIGLIHAYLIWYGDVLVAYACCGILLFPIRRLPPSLLLAAGVVMVSLVVGIRYIEEHGLSPLVTKITIVQNQIYGNELGIDRELEVYRGGFLGQLDNRARLSLGNQTTWFVLWGFWRYGGSMLIGMGLLGMRFFHGEWPNQTYRTLAVVLIPVGWSITIAGILYNQSMGWDQAALFAHGENFNYMGSLVTAIGYLSAGVLIAKHVAMPENILTRAMAAPIRAVGKAALSNYIFQGVACTLIFYGHGLGWFGYLTRIQLLGVVAGVWAVQMVGSMLWLTVFRQGPLEWLWHRLAHGRAKA